MRGRVTIYEIPETKLQQTTSNVRKGKRTSNKCHSFVTVSKRLISSIKYTLNPRQSVISRGGALIKTESPARVRHYNPI